MSPQLNWGWIGIAAYGISYGLSNLFVLGGDYESAVALWFAGLYGVFALYAGLRWTQTGRRDALIAWVILLLANVLTREYTDFWAEYSFGPRLWSLGLLVCIAWTVWLIFREFNRGQLFERCVWAVLLIAFEGWAVVEYLVCKVVPDPSVAVWVDSIGWWWTWTGLEIIEFLGLSDQPSEAWLREHWGHDVSKYSCRRWAGDFWPQIDQALAGLVLLYLGARYAWARRGLQHKR